MSMKSIPNALWHDILKAIEIIIFGVLCWNE